MSSTPSTMVQDPEKGYETRFSSSSPPSTAGYHADTEAVPKSHSPHPHPHAPHDGSLALAETSPASHPPPGVGPAPDGGFWAWCTVAGGYLAVFVQFGLINTFGVFQAYYEVNQLRDYSESEIAWIGSVQQLILFFVGLFVGRVFDAHGAHVLLIPGGIIFVLSLMMTSLCKEYYQFFLAQGLLFGLGSGLIFYPAISIPGQWFVKKRALAMAIVGSSSGLGGTLWPIALKRLFDEIGFEWAIRTVAFISLFLFALSWFMIRTRLPRKKPTPWRAFWHPLKESPFLLMTACVSLVFFGMYTPFFFASNRALELGASESLAFYTIAFINAGSTVGRLVAAVGDQWGAFNVLIVSALGSTLSLLAFWIPSVKLGALIACTPTYGFFVGMFISIIPACVALTGPASEIGLRVGLLWTIVAVFAFTGPPIGGAIVGQHPGELGYQLAGVFSGVVTLAGLVCGIGSKVKIGGSLWGIM